MLIPKTNNCEQQTWLGIDYGILISAHYNLGSIILMRKDVPGFRFSSNIF